MPKELLAEMNQRREREARILEEENAPPEEEMAMDEGEMWRALKTATDLIGYNPCQDLALTSACAKIAHHQKNHPAPVGVGGEVISAHYNKIMLEHLLKDSLEISFVKDNPLLLIAKFDIRNNRPMNECNFGLMRKILMLAGDGLEWQNKASVESTIITEINSLNDQINANKFPFIVANREGGKQRWRIDETKIPAEVSKESADFTEAVNKIVDDVKKCSDSLLGEAERAALLAFGVCAAKKSGDFFEAETDPTMIARAHQKGIANPTLKDSLFKCDGLAEGWLYYPSGNSRVDKLFELAIVGVNNFGIKNIESFARDPKLVEMPRDAVSREPSAVASHPVATNPATKTARFFEM